MASREIIVAQTGKSFDLLFRQSALIATFITASDHERFADRNQHLTDEMESIAKRIYGESFADAHTGVGWDWWPDHTRHMECDAKSFSQELFDSICALLAAEYVEWRIQVIVCHNIMKGHTLIGAVAIWSDKLLIDRKLYDWMIDHQFNFGTSVEARFVSVDTEEGLKSRTLLDDVDQRRLTPAEQD